MHQRLSAYAAIFRLVTDLAPIALLLKPIINSSSSSDSIQMNLPYFSTHPTDSCGSAFKRKHIISHFDGHNNAQSLQGRRPLTIFFPRHSRRDGFQSWITTWWLGFNPRLVHPAACASHAHTAERHDFSRTKAAGIERVTEVNNDWHQHLHLSPHLQTNDSWRPAIPQSAAVRHTAFNLGQHSHVHPARLEWYIVGARRLAGGSTLRREHR